MNTALRPVSKLLPRIRRGRCYELSGRYLMGDSSWLLVHGTGRGRTGRIGHAWLMRDDTVYDPVLNQSFERNEYLARFDVEPRATYTATEAAQHILANGHWGPW